MLLFWYVGRQEVVCTYQIATACVPNQILLVHDDVRASIAPHPVVPRRRFPSTSNGAGDRSELDGHFEDLYDPRATGGAYSGDVSQSVQSHDGEGAHLRSHGDAGTAREHLLEVWQSETGPHVPDVVTRQAVEQRHRDEETGTDAVLFSVGAVSKSTVPGDSGAADDACCVAGYVVIGECQYTRTTCFMHETWDA